MPRAGTNLKVGLGPIPEGVDEDQLWNKAMGIALAIMDSDDVPLNVKVRILGHILGWRGKVRPKGATSRLAKVLALVNSEEPEAAES